MNGETAVIHNMDTVSKSGIVCVCVCVCVFAGVPFRVEVQWSERRRIN